MNKDEDFELEENIITVSSKELKNILISKIAPNEIVEIADIDEKNDRCVLIADNLMPQRCRLAMPYSALDNPVIDFGNGAKIYVDHP